MHSEHTKHSSTTFDIPAMVQLCARKANRRQHSGDARNYPLYAIQKREERVDGNKNWSRKSIRQAQVGVYWRNSREYAFAHMAHSGDNALCNNLLPQYIMEWGTHKEILPNERHLTGGPTITLPFDDLHGKVIPINQNESRNGKVVPIPNKPKWT